MPDTPVVIVGGSKARTGLAIAGFAIVLLLLAAAGYFMKSLRDENVRLRSEMTQFKALTETLVRSSTQWATKGDVESRMRELLTKEDLKAVKEDLDRLGSHLAAVGKTMGAISRKVSELEKSDSEGPPNALVEKCDDGRLIDTHGYTKASQIKELEDGNKAPVAKVRFNAAEAKPWSYEVYGREYHLTTIVGRKDDGQLTFHHTLEYGVPDVTGTMFPVTLKTSEYLQVPLSRRMFWWTPALDAGVFAGGRVHSLADGGEGIFSFGADMGFSFSSYGRTKADSLLRFFRLGAGYDAQRTVAHFSFAPIQANLGDPLPFLTNLWLWPYAAFDTAGGVDAGLAAGFRL
jgi:hypothetical protein